MTKLPGFEIFSLTSETSLSTYHYLWALMHLLQTLCYWERSPESLMKPHVRNSFYIILEKGVVCLCDWHVFSSWEDTAHPPLNFITTKQRDKLIGQYFANFNLIRIMWKLDKNEHPNPRDLVKYFWSVTLQLESLKSTPAVSDTSGLVSHLEEYWCGPYEWPAWILFAAYSNA